MVAVFGSTRQLSCAPPNMLPSCAVLLQMDPHALEDGDDEEYECDQEQQKQQRGVMRQSPGKALRSLHFGRQQDSNGAPAKKT